MTFLVILMCTSPIFRPKQISNFFMKNLYKYILGLGFTCTSLVAIAFVTLSKKPTGTLTPLNLDSAKSKLNFLDSFTNDPEKKTSDNSTLKSTLKGHVQTTSNLTIGLTAVATEQNVQLLWTTPKGHNSRKFIIQRSKDSEKFYGVEEIKPA